MPETVIEVRGVSKFYGDFTAVDNVTFDVYRGEIFSMLGPNGAGKTSTIRMILDILKPDEGSIQVFGAPFSEKTKERIGYLPEERGLYKNVPVIELLTYLAALKGMKPAAARRKAEALLEEFGMTANRKSKVKELSKGMSQKIQFISTILHEPDLIIVDEPFSGLDPVNTEMIKQLIFRMRARGTTIVMSIHQMNQVEEMADRLIMINKGKRVLYGPVDVVRDQYAENAVIVQGEGHWEALPGVTEVIREENGRGAKLKLAAVYTPNQLMAYLASDERYKVRSYALAVPSLNDIFIRVAGENPEPTPEAVR